MGQAESQQRGERGNRGEDASKYQGYIPGKLTKTEDKYPPHEYYVKESKTYSFSSRDGLRHRNNSKKTN